MKNTKRLLFTVAAVIFSAHASAITLIAHPETPASLDAQQVKRIFLGKQVTLPDGERAVPVNQTQANPTRLEFDTQVLGRSSSQIQAYWSKLVFTGKGNPPKEMASDADTIAYIKKTPGAVGYVSDNTHPEGLRIITLVD